MLYGVGEDIVAERLGGENTFPEWKDDLLYRENGQL